MMFEPSGRSPHDVLAALTGEVAVCALPALVIRLPDKEILAASPAALGMLTGKRPHRGGRRSAHTRSAIVGRDLESFMADTPSDAAEMLMTGRARGYSARRMLRVGDRDVATRIRVWPVDDLPDVVVAVLDADAALRDTPELDSFEVPMARSAVGSTDANLVVDRISDDVEALIGEPPASVVGRSLLTLVEVADLGALLCVLAQRCAAESGIRMTARLRGLGTVSHPGQLMILPLKPVASCTFVFTPLQMLSATIDSMSGSNELLSTLASTATADALARSAAWLSTPSDVHRALLEKLTSREAEIVCRLVRGDRVPGIARDLFLAQSTVRNHLSAAYAKLGVFSQQAVIDLFRDPGIDADTSPIGR